MKFSHKVVAISACILIVVVALLSFSQLRIVRDHVETLIYNTMDDMVSSVSVTVSTDMEAKESLAQIIADTVSLAPNDREYVAKVLGSSKLKSSFAVVGMGYQRDGKLIENDPNWKPSPDYDPRKRPWYINAEKKGQLFVMQPYLDVATGTMIISIAVPVYDQGQFVGAICFDFSMSALSEIVNSINPFRAGYLFIVTNQGQTIAHPDKSLIGQPMSKYLPDISVSSKVQHFEKNDSTHIVLFKPVPGKDWSVGVQVDKSIAFKLIDKLVMSSGISVVVGLIVSVILLGVCVIRLMAPLRALDQAIQNVASGHGDLTQRLETNLEPEFASLASGFNRFIEILQTRVKQSKELSHDLSQGSQLTTAGAEQSMAHMQSQMQEVDQLATAMNEMAATASEVAANAQRAATLALDANSVSLEGDQVVNKNTDLINRLSQRVEKAVEEVQQLESATANIEKIIEVINEIADQTNLLALNAAIEAARAGDSGRGFAVVADEVRTLAQRTQESTTEIRTMIEKLQASASAVSVVMTESQSQADQAVSQSQAANDALMKIRDAIQQINDMNTQIATAAEEQSSVSEEINSNTLRIKELSDAVYHAAETAKIMTIEQSDKARQQEKILSQFIV